VLKSESRRKHFAGDGGAALVVDIREMTGLVAALVDEGVGEVVRAVGVGEVVAGSRRGTSVRKSPVESTDGGINEAVGSGSVCIYSSMGREYTRPSFLSVNTTSA
jgi:hypothetical protein